MKIPLGALHELTGEEPPPLVPLWDERGKRADVNLYLIGSKSIPFTISDAAVTVVVEGRRYGDPRFSTTSPSFQIGSFVTWKERGNEKELSTALITNVRLAINGREWHYELLYHKVTYKGSTSDSKIVESRGQASSVDENRLEPVSKLTDIGRLLTGLELYEPMLNYISHARNDGKPEAFKLSPEDVRLAIEEKKKW